MPLRDGDALLLVDVQRDFCPGGALPVAGGDEILPVLNRWIQAARQRGLPVYASRDWHPLRHPSFRDEGGEWPVHCLQDSEGARFHPALQLPEDAIVVSKGVRFDRDQISAFDETGLAERLARDGVRRLWVGGLAEDVCVLHTVLDARRAGFQVQLVPGGSRALSQEQGRRARERMRAEGARVEAAS